MPSRGLRIYISPGIPPSNLSLPVFCLILRRDSSPFVRHACTYTMVRSQGTPPSIPSAPTIGHIAASFAASKRHKTSFASRSNVATGSCALFVSELTCPRKESIDRYIVQNKRFASHASELRIGEKKPVEGTHVHTGGRVLIIAAFCGAEAKLEWRLPVF